ncbi:hypothetical protein GEMRC1_006093 [Eukaryota sp. GEM-RC1]
MTIFSLYPEVECTVAPMPRDHVKIQKCVNKLTGNFAVLKTYIPTKAAHKSEIAREQFFHNSTPQHPNVIRYYAFDDNPESGETTILMDYVCGGDLHNHIHGKKGNLHNTGRTYSGDEMWKRVAQLINIVDFLHESLKICHRDLKTQNILLDENGDFVVMDFGHVRNIDGTEFETKGLGSLLYNPREMQRGSTEPSHDISTDYFKLGVMLYEMIIGRWPFIPKDYMKPVEALEKEIGELQVGPPPDCSGLPPSLAGYVEGLLHPERDPRRLCFRQMLNDNHIRYLRDIHQSKRPRFVKIAPWSDCDYLIVSDKAPSELLEEVCCLSEKAQVLRVNCDSLCLCAETANAFVQHLMEFIIPGSEVNTSVVFQMVDEDLNSLLYDCWFDLH